MEGLRRRKTIEKPEIANLPPPLSPAEEARVMEDLSSGDETRIKEAKTTLIMNNQRFVMFTARRFFRPGAAYPFGNLDDLFSIGLIGLTKAANTFDLSRGKVFLNYAGPCIKNEILMEKREETRGLKSLGFVGSLDEKIEVEDGRMTLGSQVPDSRNDTEGSFLGREEEAEKRRLLTRAIVGLGERARRVISLLYGFENNYNPTGQHLTEGQIAELMGFSPTYINKLKRRALQKMRPTFIDFIENQK